MILILEIQTRKGFRWSLNSIINDNNIENNNNIDNDYEIDNNIDDHNHNDNDAYNAVPYHVLQYRASHYVLFFSSGACYLSQIHIANFLFLSCFISSFISESVMRIRILYDICF